MKRYKEYKDSGVEWIGEIPSHWEVKKLKYITSLTYGNSLPKENRNEGSVNVYGSNGVVDSNLLSNTLNETIIVGRKGSYGKVNYSHRSCFVIDTAYYVDKRNTRSHIKWLYYLLQILELDKNSQDTGVPGLSRDYAYNLIATVPTINEQKLIAEYLDKKTSQIETIISKKEELIETLKHSKTKLISETITKGLDKNVSMKDNQVEWIGEIPSDWEISKLKYNIEKTKGYAFKSELFGDEGVPVVKASDIKNKTIVSSDNYINLNIAKRYKSVMLLEGDIIMSTVGSTPDVKNSAVGQIAYIPKSVEGSLLNQNTVILRINEKKLLYNRFLFYMLCSSTFRKYLDLYAHGTANQASLSLVDILNYDIAIPSKSDQYKIVDYLDKKIVNIDKLIFKVDEQIEILKKAEQKLITEVVTGKIDVTNL
ncbi:restriction endonuclease subunit S [Terrisporobacter glycolicus]|nr:restriction endonuclease subunit S [Terrisporobacter glycolicus]